MPTFQRNIPKTQEAFVINNAPETQDQAQNLTTQLERIEQALIRLVSAPQLKRKLQLYTDVTQ